MSYPTPKPSEALSPPEVDAVIQMLLYHATPEARQALMTHQPVAYLRLCGNHPTIREEVLKRVAKAMDEVR